MKAIMDTIKDKKFLIGLAVGIVGVMAYNKYAKKDNSATITISGK